MSQKGFCSIQADYKKMLASMNSKIKLLKSYSYKTVDSGLLDMTSSINHIKNLMDVSDNMNESGTIKTLSVCNESVSSSWTHVDEHVSITQELNRTWSNLSVSFDCSSLFGDFMKPQTSILLAENRHLEDDLSKVFKAYQDSVHDWDKKYEPCLQKIHAIWNLIGAFNQLTNITKQMVTSYSAAEALKCGKQVLNLLQNIPDPISERFLNISAICSDRVIEDRAVSLIFSGVGSLRKYTSSIYTEGGKILFQTWEKCTDGMKILKTCVERIALMAKSFSAGNITKFQLAETLRDWSPEKDLAKVQIAIQGVPQMLKKYTKLVDETAGTFQTTLTTLSAFEVPIINPALLQQLDVMKRGHQLLMPCLNEGENNELLRDESYTLKTFVAHNLNESFKPLEQTIHSMLWVPEIISLKEMEEIAVSFEQASASLSQNLASFRTELQMGNTFYM